MDDGAADRAAEVLVAKLLLGNEDGVYAEGFVAIEVVGRPVELVGAGLDDEVGCGAWISAGFGGGLRHHRELLDGVDGHDGAGDALNTGLIHGGVIGPEVVVVGAVDLPVGLVGARAVDGAEDAGVATEAGKHADELLEVAAVERDVLQQMLGQYGGLLHVAGVEREGVGGDLDGGGLFGDGELDGQRVGGAGADGYTFDVVRLKARDRGGDGVTAKREVSEGVVAGAGGDGGACDACAFAGGSHGRVGDGGAGLILQAAADGSAKGLRVHVAGDRGDGKSEDESRDEGGPSAGTRKHEGLRKVSDASERRKSQRGCGDRVAGGNEKAHDGLVGLGEANGRIERQRKHFEAHISGHEHTAGQQMKRFCM